ncbi:NAD(P)/FAD-dependent oxidoreductase [Geomonas sp. RF6]|uniref:phytoene desaturase family protein n=1 Tax=Geomonas sp. RF6 TaxID=2897342 RepID=UPI001E284038|nr:NAD(P)/FAD-dependent oxidoreductase [Geomonas sp. RF6]UFS69356.1 NAD(P)/FAD-dependent oxidoreductase [Geomonas sp. RF6]
MYDCIVIGAGISGITSAITLAQHGYQVALLEKAQVSAPVLRGFSRRGVHFDTGFHYAGGLAPGEPLDLFLRYLGVLDGIATFPFSDEGFDIFHCASERFQFAVPAGYDRLREALSEAFPAERGAVERYLEMVAAVCREMPYLNLDAEIDSGNMLQRVIGPSLSDVLDALTENRLLKSVLSMHTLLYGVSRSEISFAQHASIVGGYYESARGIRGGGVSLARVFDARLETLGVECRTGCGVSEICVSPGGEVSGVRLDSGEVLAAKACISTVHPRMLLHIAPHGAFRPAYRKRLEMLEETVSACIAFATCNDSVPALAGCNRFLLPDPEALEHLGARGIEDGPLYLSAAYRNGGSDPAGFLAIFPAKAGETERWGESSLGRRPQEYGAFKSELLERMRGRIEREFPELAATIEHFEGSTPLTIRDYCSNPGGGLYGVKHMVGQYNPHPVTRVSGLFLAGQGVVAPGLLGAVLSGLLACGSILGHDRLRKDIKGCS